jgi:hypothetical protein
MPDTQRREQKMFEQIDPPEPTPRQIEDDETVERRITDAVCSRMRDPDYVIDALSVLITDNPLTQTALSDIVIGHGDMAVNVGNLRCDVAADIRAQAEWDYERGQL